MALLKTRVILGHVAAPALAPALALAPATAPALALAPVANVIFDGGLLPLDFCVLISIFLH